ALGLRPLQRQERGLCADVAHRHAVACVTRDPGEVGGRIRCIHDQHEAVGREPEHDQVVQHTARVVAENRVLPVTVAETADVVHGQLLAQRRRSLPAQLDLAHVAHVEQAAVRPHGAMLVERPGVGDRHVPAGELHDARPELAMRLEERGTPAHHAAPVRSAAVTVLASSIATVIGPTPPGTGGVWLARSAAGPNSTSPRTLPSAPRLIPTSITTEPGFTHSPRTRPPRPAAAIRTSAFPTSPARSAVREWHMVTVACRSSSRKATGLPTRRLRPTTTARAPRGGAPTSSSGRITPSGVRGRRPGCPAMRWPWLTGWSPSTSFAGGIASITACASRPAGRGGCPRRPCTRAACPSPWTSSSSSACAVLAGSRWPNDAMPTSRQARSLLPTYTCDATSSPT